MKGAGNLPKAPAGGSTVGTSDEKTNAAGIIADAFETCSFSLREQRTPGGVAESESARRLPDLLNRGVEPHSTPY